MANPRIKPRSWNPYVEEFQRRFMKPSPHNHVDGIMGPRTFEVYNKLPYNRRAYVRFRGWHGRIAFTLHLTEFLTQYHLTGGPFNSRWVPR